MERVHREIVRDRGGTWGKERERKKERKGCERGKKKEKRKREGGGV